MQGRLWNQTARQTLPILSTQRSARAQSLNPIPTPPPPPNPTLNSPTTTTTHAHTHTNTNTRTHKYNTPFTRPLGTMSATPVGYLYTPQQLMGSVKYGSGILLGNWREDDALDEMRLMDYVEHRENGNLALLKQKGKLGPQLAAATLSRCCVLT